MKVNPDHVRQVQVWDMNKSSWNKKPFQIWWMLTEASVRVTNLPAVFVRVNAYKPAGGTMLLDWLVTDEEATHTKLLSEYQALEEEYARQDEPPPRSILSLACWKQRSKRSRSGR